MAVIVALSTTKIADPKGRQDSNESPNGDGGLFTSILVEAITTKRGATDQDGNGVVDLRELYRAVKTPVSIIGHKLQLSEPDETHEQTRWLARNSLVGEMSLF